MLSFSSIVSFYPLDGHVRKLLLSIFCHGMGGSEKSSDLLRFFGRCLAEPRLSDPQVRCAAVGPLVPKAWGCEDVSSKGSQCLQRGLSAASLQKQVVVSLGPPQTTVPLETLPCGRPGASPTPPSQWAQHHQRSVCPHCCFSPAPTPGGFG